MNELQVEYEIQKDYEKQDAMKKAEAQLETEAYKIRNELYRKTYPAPAFYDADKSEEGVRPEIYPMIIAQVNGLVQVLRWAPWAGAYAVTGIRRQQYVHPDYIRFWMPMPEEIDAPEGFYE